MDERIIQILEVFGRLATPELASKLTLPREVVFGRCKRLERDGRLTSELGKFKGMTIYFHPMTGLMQTSSTYGVIQKFEAAVRAIVTAYTLPGEAAHLVRALELELRRLGNEVPEGKQEHFEEFGAELFALAKKAKMRSEVNRLLGLRPTNPTVRFWRLGPQLSLT